MSLTVVTFGWNLEKHGFPWVEMVSEALASADEVVFVHPECAEDRTADLLDAWAKVEPKLKVIHAPRALHYTDFPKLVNLGIEAATSDYILHLQCDEAMEVSAVGDWFDHNLAIHREFPFVVEFPRLDFTYSSKLVTPIFEGEPPVRRMFARKHYPLIKSDGDAMHVTGEAQVVRCDVPIFHYHGLRTEAGWKRKEAEFQARYFRDGDYDRRIDDGWAAWKGPGSPESRARAFEGQHPRVMLPYLARAEMHLRSGE